MAKAVAAAVLGSIVLAGCAPIRGYPADPEDTGATLDGLQPYFNGKKEAEYNNAPAAGKMGIRNEIIYARLHAYDIEFADFEKRLYGDGNTVSLGSDLVGLILAGLTATTGTAATKSALGAASAGVIGADTAINKDLYYQKTIPALLAQMEADRLLAKKPIIDGIKAPDEQYPLIEAYTDLDAYKNAGSIPAAINAVNKDTGNAKDDAQAAISLPPASAAGQLKAVQTVEAALDTLTTDAQFIALARAMQINLYSRSPGLQQEINALDSKGLRLSGNGKVARQVMYDWAQDDDPGQANADQWLMAIAAAAQAK